MKKKQSNIQYMPAIIRLGMKSLNCKRQGICEVEAIAALPKVMRPILGKAYALIVLGKKSVLEIQFLTVSIDRETLKKHFSNNVFTVEEAYIFEASFDGNSINYTIPRGKYQLGRKDKYYVLSLETLDRSVAIKETSIAQQPRNSKN